MKKRRNHYVWGYYLQPWCINGENLWCKIHDKIHCTPIRNLANKRDLYIINDLTTEEIENLLKLFVFESPKELRRLNQNWINLFRKVILIRKLTKRNNLFDILAKKYDKILYNFEEELHSQIEIIGSKYIRFLRNGNTDFYKNSTDKANFIIYLCTQYFRTLSFHDRIIKVTQKFPNIRIENSWSIIVHLLATKLGYGIHCAIDEYKLVLLKNISNVSLLTCDQPVINTYGDYKNYELITDKMELYCPISPNIGMLLTQASQINDDMYELNEEDVRMYNKMICNATYQQIYASNESELQSV